MTEPVFPRLLAALGMLVLRRDPERGFVIEGERPVWFLRLFPDHAAEAIVPVEERFPFLASFLPTAENFWGSRGHGRIWSGYWVERNPAGQEVPLRASVLCLDDDDYLIVEYVKGIYEEQKGMLQKARNHALDRDKRDIP
jgi:hypothetical protein